MSETLVFSMPGASMCPIIQYGAHILFQHLVPRLTLSTLVVPNLSLGWILLGSIGSLPVVFHFGDS